MSYALFTSSTNLNQPNPSRLPEQIVFSLLGGTRTHQQGSSMAAKRDLETRCEKIRAAFDLFDKEKKGTVIVE